MTQRIVSVLAIAASTLCLPAAAADFSRGAIQRHQLQTEQQQDAVSLGLRQSLGRRSDLSPADTRQLDQLQLQQRVEQQMLNQQQEQQLRQEIQMQRNARSVPSAIRDQQVTARRNTFDAEREVQMQQFELQQRRITDTAPRAPLQPPVGSPQLTLP